MFTFLPFPSSLFLTAFFSPFFFSGKSKVPDTFSGRGKEKKGKPQVALRSEKESGERKESEIFLFFCEFFAQEMCVTKRRRRVPQFLDRYFEFPNPNPFFSPEKKKREELL